MKKTLFGILSVLLLVSVVAFAAIIDVGEARTVVMVGGSVPATGETYEVGPLTFDTITLSEWTAIVGNTANVVVDSTGAYIDGYAGCPNLKTLYYNAIELSSSSHTVQGDLTCSGTYDSGGITFNCTTAHCFYAFFDNTRHICIQDDQGNLGPTCSATAEASTGTYTVKVTLATNTVNVWVDEVQRITNATITNKNGTYMGMYLDSNSCNKSSVDNLSGAVP